VEFATTSTTSQEREGRLRGGKARVVYRIAEQALNAEEWLVQVLHE
jgi:hypothetical protein